MDIEKLRDSPVGSLVPIKGVHRGAPFEWWAFIPSPLPTAVGLAPATLKALEAAAMALARLDGALQALPDPRLLARPAVREEGVSTSAIEGTYTALPELLEAEAAENQAIPPNVRETLRYIAAHDRAFGLIGELPVCMRLLCEAHAQLTHGDPRVPESESGVVRRRQNMIGDPGAEPSAADFVPTPPGNGLSGALDEWEHWLHREDDIPLLVRIALAHYQFEVIHPFIDGNGRVGRLLVSLMLHEHGVLSHPVMNVSPYFEASRDEYVSHLAEIPKTGDFDPWVRFFLVGVERRSRAGLERVAALTALGADLASRVRSSGLRGVARDISGSLIGYPVMTPMIAKGLFDVSYQAANAAIARLVDIGILKEVTGKSYGRLFVAPDVIGLLTQRQESER